MDYSKAAIEAVQRGSAAFCKFLAANDTKKTKANQSGFLVPVAAYTVLFNKKPTEDIVKRIVKIKWQDGSITESCFTWYASKREYRITRFGRNFEFLHENYTGALFVLSKLSDDDYEGFFLNTDDEIQSFLNAFGMSPTDAGNLINKENVLPEVAEKTIFDLIIEETGGIFPESTQMSSNARRAYEYISRNKKDILVNPDKCIVKWTETEYRLFRYYEQIQYGSQIKTGFDTVEEFVNYANKVLNRRKSRAGKSLEHHLAAVFDANNVLYSAQPKTEGNKKPDFIMPSIEKYHDPAFDFLGLTYLGAKTTCKDRWRQILSEADRIPEKHLFTLQQGISSQQLDEMKEANVILVVPQEYIKMYPETKRDIIINFKSFIQMVKEKQNTYI